MRLAILLLLSVPVFGQVTWYINNSTHKIEQINWNGRNWVGFPGWETVGVFRSSSDGTSCDEYLWDLSGYRTYAESGLNYIYHEYFDSDPRKFSVMFTLSQHDDNTLKINAVVTNLGSKKLCGLQLDGALPQFMTPSQPSWTNGFSCAVAAKYSGTFLRVASAGDANNMISFWYEPQSLKTFSVCTHIWINESWNISPFMWWPSSVNGKMFYDLLDQGQSFSVNIYVRFSNTIKQDHELVPEAFEDYGKTWPMKMIWPDRRPMAMLFVCQPEARSSTNPRGYYWDPNLNALDPPTFASRTASYTSQVLGILNALDPRPQGIIIWDLEGCETDMIYMGYPNKLPDLAPEMDAVVDTMIKQFRAHGYDVGMTIRPQTFDIGNALPSTCTYDDNVDYRDRFILLTASPPYRGYICNAPNTWVQEGAGAPWGQKNYTSIDDGYSEFRKKIAYARSRWGAKIFYLDSNWLNGSIASPTYEALKLEFPDILLIPEWLDLSSRDYGAKLHQAPNQEHWRVSDAGLLIWPDAFGVMQNMNGSTSGTLEAVSYGMIDLYHGWFSSDEHSNYANALSLVRTAASSVVVSGINSGKKYSFGANPTIISSIPRIAFSSGSFNGSEATYCEYRGYTLCYQAGTRQTSNTLDLSGFNYYRLEYRDWHGRLISASEARSLN